MSVFVIAEAGVNHNNDLAIAKQLVAVAKEAGADAVKFQSYKTENLVTLTAPKANYQKSSEQNTGPDNSQFAMLKKLELSQEFHFEILEFCKLYNIEFMSTAFDIDTLKFLISLDIKRIKIPSGEITNFPLLKNIASYNLPIILSTGMSNIIEIQEAIDLLTKHCPVHNPDLTLLHCTSSYPAPYDQVNLKALLTLKKQFNLPIGYSDHTIDNLISPVAVGLGATVIEKHFTIDRSLPGPDHKMSITPNELKNLINNIRSVEEALGDGVKQPTINELEIRDVARRSLFVNKNCDNGDILTEDHISLLRPGTGIAPKFLEQFIGKKVNKSLNTGELLTWECID